MPVLELLRSHLLTVHRASPMDTYRGKMQKSGLSMNAAMWVGVIAVLLSGKKMLVLL